MSYMKERYIEKMNSEKLQRRKSMEICEGCFDKLDQHAVETEDGHLLCPNCYDDYIQDMEYKHGERNEP